MPNSCILTGVNPWAWGSIIVDLDGTLALNQHRAHHLMLKPKQWDEFNAKMHLDQPNKPLITLVKCLSRYYHILLCSARQKEHEQITVDWLRKHEVPYTELYLRTTSDFRPDTEIKSDLFEQMKADGYNPGIVIEDRKSVVDMWRAKGLVCLQCAPGDF